MAIAPLASDPLGDVEVEPLMPGVVELPILLPVPEEVEGVVFSIVEPVALLPECESLILDEVLGEVDEPLPAEPDVLGEVIEPLPVEPELEPLPADSLWA
jgi:hypothetical protein